MSSSPRLILAFLIGFGLCYFCLVRRDSRAPIDISKIPNAVAINIGFSKPGPVVTSVITTTPVPPALAPQTSAPPGKVEVMKVPGHAQLRSLNTEEIEKLKGDWVGSLNDQEDSPMIKLRLAGNSQDGVEAFWDNAYLNENGDDKAQNITAIDKEKDRVVIRVGQTQYMEILERTDNYMWGAVYEYQDQEKVSAHFMNLYKQNQR